MSRKPRVGRDHRRLGGRGPRDGPGVRPPGERTSACWPGGATDSKAATREVEELGGRALVLPTDVADPDQVEAAAAAVDRAFGPVDVWVNDAMVSVFSPFTEMTAEEFRRVTEVTYLGFVYGTMTALRRMAPGRTLEPWCRSGQRVAYRGIPLQSAYCGAKHAIQGFTESVRCELLH